VSARLEAGDTGSSKSDSLAVFMLPLLRRALTACFRLRLDPDGGKKMKMKKKRERRK
jgi:hypothetical protein